MNYKQAMLLSAKFVGASIGTIAGFFLIFEIMAWLTTTLGIWALLVVAFIVWFILSIMLYGTRA